MWFVSVVHRAQRAFSFLHFNLQRLNKTQPLQVIHQNSFCCCWCYHCFAHCQKKCERARVYITQIGDFFPSKEMSERERFFEESHLLKVSNEREWNRPKWNCFSYKDKWNHLHWGIQKFYAHCRWIVPTWIRASSYKRMNLCAYVFSMVWTKSFEHRKKNNVWKSYSSKGTTVPIWNILKNIFY